VPNYSQRKWVFRDPKGLRLRVKVKLMGHCIVWDKCGSHVSCHVIVADSGGVNQKSRGINEAASRRTSEVVRRWPLDGEPIQQAHRIEFLQIVFNENNWKDPVGA
jgi:hypothetical protein